MDGLKILLTLFLTPFVAVGILFVVVWLWLTIKDIWNKPLPKRRQSLRWSEKKGWHHG